MPSYSLCLSMRAKAKNRGELLTVRVGTAVHKDFKLAAELRGATMSGLVHQFVVKTIREEKEREPGAFGIEPVEPEHKNNDSTRVLRLDKRVRQHKLGPKSARSKSKTAS